MADTVKLSWMTTQTSSCWQAIRYHGQNHHAEGRASIERMARAKPLTYFMCLIDEENVWPLVRQVLQNAEMLENT